MDTDLATRDPESALVFTPQRIELVKSMICVGASDDELQLFIATCQRTRLDPFARQIYAIKRYDSRQTREVMGIQVGIDGLRLIAQRTGKYAGQSPPEWCAADSVWRDTWPSRLGVPMAARVGVFVEGQARPTYGIAHYDEFVQTKKDGHPIAVWEKMPANQLAKCAEAQALRKNFPNETSGLRVAGVDDREQASLEQIAADRQEQLERVHAPPPGQKPGVGFGGRSLEEIGYDLDGPARGFPCALCGEILDLRSTYTAHVAAHGAEQPERPIKPPRKKAASSAPEPTSDVETQVEIWLNDLVAAEDSDQVNATVAQIGRGIGHLTVEQQQKLSAAHQAAKARLNGA